MCTASFFVTLSRSWVSHGGVTPPLLFAKEHPIIIIIEFGVGVPESGVRSGELNLGGLSCQTR